ncbi:S15/NS1 RNA-binding domain-containing protein [Rickenella mellea]|uniref:S15/NS1 RNA-binding domain-containing protein n=1 Tax=Rickenella mellea TaxID=50990 RepID=A0A4Y7PWB4_9AGAM|nr:S15/NS1 RNA-binding domain-containing protein [Rickenella mellea]
MFKSYAVAVSRSAVASTSALSGCSWLHTSTVAKAAVKQHRDIRTIRRENAQRKAEKIALREKNKPHVALGHRPDDEDKWLNCDLRKVILTQQEIDTAAQEQIIKENGTIGLPKHLSFGVDGGGVEDVRKANVDFFFDDLPGVSALRTMEASAHYTYYWRSQYKERETAELRKADMFARAIDLRNANADGIAFENRRRVISAFSEPSHNPYDPGRAEVQVALLTMRIRGVWDHLVRCKKDIFSRRSLRRLVHQRAKMLKYVKKIDRTRYDAILERCGLEREAVEGELVV